MTRAEQIEAAARAMQAAHGDDHYDARECITAKAALDAALALPPDPVPSVSERERALVRAGLRVAYPDDMMDIECDGVITERPKEIKQPDTAVCKLYNTAACGDPECCPDNPFVAIEPADAALIVAAINALPGLLTVARTAKRVLNADNPHTWRPAVGQPERPASESTHAKLALTTALAALDAPRKT